MKPNPPSSPPGGVRVLVVDDERHMVDALTIVLGEEYQVRSAGDGETALAMAAESPPHVALLDIMLPGISGLEVLKRLREVSPETVAVMVTAVNDVKSAVEAMKAGAYDYIVKPFDGVDILRAVGKAAEKAALRREVASLREEVAGAFGLHEMVGATPAMQDLFRAARKVADQDVNVLVCGESGTGKELVARAIHYGGARRRGPFVAVNCGRLGSELTESELFGHEKGAFTGAMVLHRGTFEQADGGTLFLDEIGTTPPAVQAKLLRILEERRVTRLGGERDVEVDIRVVAATNADLLQAVRNGAFRQDLFYRLNVIRLEVPPLRERRDDVPLLVEHFLRKHRRRIASPVRAFSPEAMEILRDHPWRGNVRELENVVLTLVCMAEKETIDSEDLDSPILEPPGPPPGPLGPDAESRDRVLKALEECDWKLAAAGRRLGVHRNTVRNLMARYGIRKPRRGGKTGEGA